ncbi:DEAD/DEAH box helicase family protein [Cupriavidus sp. 8B]
MNDAVLPTASKFLHDQRGWTLAEVEQWLDLSGGDTDLAEVGSAQLTATLALHAILLEHGTAYLADEVGMGKTYVALAIVALLRRRHTGLRVLYLTPSRNVRIKWARRECRAFNRLLERKDGGAGVILHPYEYDTIKDWVHGQARDQAASGACDAFLSFSAFSFQLDDDPAAWGHALQGLLTPTEYGGKCKDEVKDTAARKVYELLRGYDLLVFDEAHLLRSAGSDRAHFIRTALRGEDGVSPKFRASLLLSATPFDRDLEQLRRQLQVTRPAGGVLPEIVAALKAAAGMRDWDAVHRGLAAFLVRRSHFLLCGDGSKRSRNQYRSEQRAAAAINLRDPRAGDPETQPRHARLLQRLYTAVVQKKLVESSEASAFPMAMFAAWEAYAIRAPKRRGAGGEVAAEALDVNGDGQKAPAESALDTNLLAHLADSYRKRFDDEEPPHPKLEAESVRLARAAFAGAEKQLVFVRRIRSIDDLKSRLDHGYDKWLAALLERGTNVAADTWLALLPKQSRGAPPLAQEATARAADDDDPAPPPTLENLFCWFFRGTSDDTVQTLCASLRRPTPFALRRALTARKDWLSVIGEVDWRHLLRGLVGDILPHEHDALAAYATCANTAANPTRFDLFRCVQIAWLRLRLESLERGAPDSPLARSCADLLHYLSDALVTRQAGKAGKARDAVGHRIDARAAREALEAATLSRELDKRGLLAGLWPLWPRLRARFAAGELCGELLDEFALFREVFFALVRLDHPFVDLWMCSGTPDSDAGVPARHSAREGADGAAHLTARFCERLSMQSGDRATPLSSYHVLAQLAEGWKYVLKTNFSDLGARRADWRRLIAARITPRAPVEWASGMNANSRADIAWRFRMPGYPMVLVSTSVFQEGEDLHTFCRQVTHFGISGSPIGIEQKNGRVDRVGSIAQRRLTRAQEAEPDLIERNGIGVRFPHVAESIEWFQIRDLSHRINDYQRSLHRVGTVAQPRSASMQEALYSDDRIPEQIVETLESPFEPRLPATPLGSRAISPVDSVQDV